MYDLSSGTSVLSLEGGANWTVKFHGSDIVEFNGFDAQSILYKFDGASWNSFVVDNGFADYYSGVQFLVITTSQSRASSVAQRLTDLTL